MSDIKYYKFDSDDILEIMIDYLYSINSGYDEVKAILLSDGDEIRFVACMGREGDEKIYNVDLIETDKTIEYNGEHSYLKRHPEYYVGVDNKKK